MQNRSIRQTVGVAIVATLLFAVIAVASPLSPASAQTGGGTFAWGDNLYGQLGDGTTANHLTPETTIATALVDIAGGRHHVVGLEADGDIVAWGWNKYGQIGDGSTADRPAPVTLSSPNAIAVATGHYHSLALDGTGQAWGWGRNNLGQLGDGTTTDRLTPTQIPGASGVADVEAGREHSLAVLTNGTVVSWGTNSHGQLGLGDFSQRLTPTAVPGLTGVDILAAGRIHTLALLDDGTVMAWGDNKNGQVGDGTTTDRSSPTAVPGLTGIVDVAAFGFHSMALDDTGRVWVWGLGGNGQIGDGTTANVNSSPVQLASPTNVVAIGAGRNHSLAADDTGVIWGWGKNDLGQLGDGTTTDRPLPVQAGTIADTAKLVSGRDYSVALSTSIDPPAPDTNAPDGTIVEPVHKSQVNSPVLFSGTAIDDVGVGEVKISIKRLSDGLWLRKNGTFGSRQRHTANLSSPGAASTDWDISLAMPDETYRVYLRVADTSSNLDPTEDKHKFTVISGVPDTTPPDGVIDLPVDDTTVSSPVLFSGTASDDVGVAEASVAVKRLSDGQWLQSNGTFGGYERLPATLSNPGGPTTDWDISLVIPADDYRVFLRVFDTSDNKDPSVDRHDFTVD